MVPKITLPSGLTRWRPAFQVLASGVICSVCAGLIWQALEWRERALLSSNSRAPKAIVAPTEAGIDQRPAALPRNDRAHASERLANISPSSEASTPAAWMPLVDRHLGLAERAAPLSSDTIDAIMRIEGMFDPTRVGYFGRSLRMEVRAGTMSMSNVFADAWTVLSRDPNVHYATHVLAQTWLWPPDMDCRRLRRVRPDESLMVFDQLTDTDCEQANAHAARVDQNAAFVAAVAASPLALPVFAAPYPGGRLTHDELIRAQELHALAARERLRILRPRF